MPSGRAEEFRRVAVRLGFERQRQTGSHERWVHPDVASLFRTDFPFARPAKRFDCALA